MTGYFALQSVQATTSGRDSANRGRRRGNLKSTTLTRKKSQEELDLLAPPKVKLPEDT